MNKIKKKILNNLKNTYCRLKKSGISGVGVFAIRDIQKNTNPFKNTKKQKWVKFNFNEIKNLDKEILIMIDDFFVIEKDNTVYIPEAGLNGIDVSFFVNHSKKANLKYSEGSQKFIATKKIKRGQELTADYGTYDEKYKSRKS